MATIFVNRDRESLGQYTEQEISNALASGKLLPTDLAWKDGMESWQPLSTFEDLPEPGSEPVEVGVPERFKNLEPNRLKPGRIRFDECLSKAWESFAANWGVCMVATLIFFVLSILVQLPMQFAQAVMERFSGPHFTGNPWILGGLGIVFVFFWIVGTAVSAILSAGFMYFFISALRTKANIDNMFAGFRGSHWIQIILAGIVWFLIIFAVVLLFMIPGVALTAALKSEVPVIAAVVLMMIPILYFSVGIGFVFPLIIDRGIGFKEALLTSFKCTHAQWFRAFFLLILVALVAMSGVVLCCIGVLATAPIAYMAWAQGYRQIFGDPDSARVD